MFWFKEEPKQFRAFQIIFTLHRKDGLLLRKIVTSVHLSKPVIFFLKMKIILKIKLPHSSISLLPLPHLSPSHKYNNRRLLPHSIHFNAKYFSVLSTYYLYFGTHCKQPHDLFHASKLASQQPLLKLWINFDYCRFRSSTASCPSRRRRASSCCRRASLSRIQQAAPPNSGIENRGESGGFCPDQNLTRVDSNHRRRPSSEQFRR